MRRLAVAALVMLCVSAVAAPAKPPRVVCTAPKWQGDNVSTVCKGSAKPLALTITLAGTSTDHSESAMIDLKQMTIGKAGTAPQVLPLSGQFGLGELVQAVDLLDVNFDGFDDIKVMTSTSAGPNASYDYWLYEPKSGLFRASKIGDQLSGMDIMPNPKTRTIAVNGRDSCCSWSVMTYKWIGSKLGATKEYEEGMFNIENIPPLDADGPQICGTVTRYFDDQGRLVSVDFDIDRAGASCDGGDPKSPTSLAGCSRHDQEKSRGLTINARNEYRFSIRYASPAVQAPDEGSSTATTGT